MRLNNLPENQITLLLGAPRSGTTWLGKILDSHPRVLYRHEPDTVRRTRDLPAVCPPEHIAGYQDMARAHMRGLMNVRALPVAGSQPVFRKSYRTGVSGTLRRWFIDVLQAGASLPVLRNRARLCGVPDMIADAQVPNVHLVLKSVLLRGSTGLLTRALPQARIVFVLRDPFSQVAAMLRGLTHGRFKSRIPMRDLLGTAPAQRAGLTEQSFRQMPVLEQLAWNWVILNEKAIDGLADLARVKVVHYQDLCRTPMLVARDVCAFLDLPWDSQTDGFIRQCIEYEGHDVGYRYYRDVTRSLVRWRDDLRQDDRARIEAVARFSPLWDQFAAAAIL